MERHCVIPGETAGKTKLPKLSRASGHDEVGLPSGFIAERRRQAGWRLVGAGEHAGRRDAGACGLNTADDRRATACVGSRCARKGLHARGIVQRQRVRMAADRHAVGGCAVCNSSTDAQRAAGRQANISQAVQGNRCVDRVAARGDGHGRRGAPIVQRQAAAAPGRNRHASRVVSIRR